MGIMMNVKDDDDGEDDGCCSIEIMNDKYISC